MSEYFCPKCGKKNIISVFRQQGASEYRDFCMCPNCKFRFDFIVGLPLNDAPMEGYCIFCGSPHLLKCIFTSKKGEDYFCLECPDCHKTYYMYEVTWKDKRIEV